MRAFDVRAPKKEIVIIPMIQIMVRKALGRYYWAVWGVRQMKLRNRRRELQGLNGAIGLVAGLGGYVGHLYSAAVATFLMLAIWIVGATLINLLTDPPEKK